MRQKIRLYTNADLKENNAIELNKEQSHYISSVMRQKEGHIVSLFNAACGEWDAIINYISKKNSSLTVTTQTRTPQKEPDLWLLFAPVKNTGVSLIVQKATELGVSKIIPITTERTIVRKINKERIEAIAIEASEQSERISIPKVLDIVSLKDILSEFPEDRKLIFCDESGNGEEAKKILLNQQKGKYAVIVGPEGGFSEAEQQVISSLDNSLPIGLGPRILKADTAVIAALSCVQMLLGDWHIAPKFE
jgi:16S rRNA (uracil1498-N3)-methyltransferase